MLLYTPCTNHHLNHSTPCIGTKKQASHRSRRFHSGDTPQQTATENLWRNGRRLQTTQPTSGEAVTAVINCCANCVNLLDPSNEGLISRFLGASRPCGPAGWMALVLTTVGDDETNPGPTTLNKRVWICDICYKQIYAMKQISIMCNRIEHWVHLRCAGIRQAQYTYTWTCHIHR